MNMRIVSILGLLCTAIASMMVSCKKTEVREAKTTFTRIDSLTEAYLSLQDSMLSTWNLMMKDESEKMDAVRQLLMALKSADVEEKEKIPSLLEQTDQLDRIRFNQKTMSNTHLVEEYDFASNSLINEVIMLVESQPGFLENEKWQALADQIKAADQRVSTYREEYDNVVTEYNNLLDKIGAMLPEIDPDNDGIKKPTFSSEDN